MRIVLTVVQVLGALIGLAGLWLLTGWGLTLLVGGILITGSAVAVEIVRLRAGDSDVDRGSMEDS